MSIPLIQKPEKDDINTSIIAIKRNIERINMLLGLVDNDSPDLSGFATKQELQDAVTELQPVDEVTVGNMHSVTSNAVAEALKYKDDWQTNQIIETDKFFQGVRLKNYLASTVNQTSGIYYFNLPEVPNNIIDVHINVEDGNNNVISDGYSDGPYTLAWAYIKADNAIRVAWGGWTILRSITMFLTYR
jgi:hypothetical protein